MTSGYDQETENLLLEEIYQHFHLSVRKYGFKNAFVKYCNE